MGWGQDVLREVSFVEEKDFIVSTNIKHVSVGWIIGDIIYVCFLFTIEIADNAFTPAINKKRIIFSECAYFVAKGKDSGD